MKTKNLSREKFLVRNNKVLQANLHYWKKKIKLKY